MGGFTGGRACFCAAVRRVDGRVPMRRRLGRARVLMSAGEAAAGLHAGKARLKASSPSLPASPPLHPIFPSFAPSLLPTLSHPPSPHARPTHPPCYTYPPHTHTHPRAHAHTHTPAHAHTRARAHTRTSTPAPSPHPTDRKKGPHPPRREWLVRRLRAVCVCGFVRIAGVLPARLRLRRARHWRSQRFGYR